jgi:hypothetical protein
MFKKLLILSALTWGSPTLWYPAWGQTPSGGVDSSQKQPNDSATGAQAAKDRGTKENPLVVDTTGHQETPKERQERQQQSAKAEAEEQHHHRVDVWTLRWSGATAIATALLVFVGIGGTIAAICTLRTIREQTIQIERQVQASHDGLRAWIGIEATENVPVSETIDIQIQKAAAIIPQPPRFSWIMKNSGQTPAFIKRVGSSHVYLDTRNLETLPIPKMHSVIGFLGAGKEKENALRIDSFTYRDVSRKSKFWRFIIKIEYLDAFEKDRVRETVASFHYYVPAGDGDPLKAGFYQEVDPANNYNT